MWGALDWTTGSANGRSNCEWNREEKKEEAEHMRAPDFRLRRKLVTRFVGHGDWIESIDKLAPVLIRDILTP